MNLLKKIKPNIKNNGNSTLSKKIPKYQRVTTPQSLEFGEFKNDISDEETKDQTRTGGNFYSTPNKRHKSLKKSLNTSSSKTKLRLFTKSKSTPKINYSLLNKYDSIGTEYSSSNEQHTEFEEDKEEEKYNSLLTQVTPRNSSSNIFRRKKKIQDLLYTSPTIPLPHKNDGSITVDTVHDVSGFNLFNASFLLNRNRKAKKQSQIRSNPNHLEMDSNSNNINNIHSNQIKSKWMSCCVNYFDSFIVSFIEIKKNECYYCLIYVALLLLDIICFILEMLMHFIVVYLIPNGFGILYEFVMNFMYYINKFIFILKDILALNDWRQRSSWKTRARLLYEKSAQDHHFYLLDEDESFHDDSDVLNQRKSRRLVERQKSSKLIKTDLGKCLVCLKGKKEIALNDCGHIVSCRKCVSGLISCPVCRTYITSSPLRLYT